MACTLLRKSNHGLLTAIEQKESYSFHNSAQRYDMKRHTITALVISSFGFVLGFLIWGTSPKETFTLELRYQGYSKVSNLATFDPLPYKKRKEKPEYTVEIGMPYDVLDDFITDHTYILVVERPNLEEDFPALFPCRLVDMKERTKG